MQSKSAATQFCGLTLLFEAMSFFPFVGFRADGDFETFNLRGLLGFEQILDVKLEIHMELKFCKR